MRQLCKEHAIEDWVESHSPLCKISCETTTIEYVLVTHAVGPKTANCVRVPQVSVLSPTLFKIIMADLPSPLDGIEGSRFMIYADDITLWVIDRGSIIVFLVLFPRKMKSFRARGIQLRLKHEVF